MVQCVLLHAYSCFILFYFITCLNVTTLKCKWPFGSVAFK